MSKYQVDIYRILYCVFIFSLHNHSFRKLESCISIDVKGFHKVGVLSIIRDFIQMLI